MRSDWRVMKDLGKITIAFPDQKFDKIEQGLNRLDDGKAKSGLNFTIDSKSNKIVGYMIDSPRIVGQGGQAYPIKGQ